MVTNVGQFPGAATLMGSLVVGGIALRQAHVQRRMQNEILTQIVARSLPLPQTALVSSGAVAARDVMADLTAAFRAEMDVGALELRNHTRLKALFSYQGTFGDTLQAGYPATGVLNLGSVFLGGLGLRADLREMEIAHKVGDTKGVFIKGVSALRDGAVVGFGATFGPFRFLSIAIRAKKTTASSLQAPTLLGRVTYAFSFLGVVFLSIIALLKTVLSGMGLAEGALLKRKLERSMDLEERIKAVCKRSVGSVSEKSIREKIEKSHRGKSQAILKKEALEYGIKGLGNLCEELGLVGKTAKELSDLIENNFDLESLGVALKIYQTQVKKEKKLSRVMTQAGKEAVEQLSYMAATRKIDNVEAESLLEVISGSLNSQMKKNLKDMTLGLITAGVQIGSIIVTGGVVLLALTFVALILSIVSLGESIIDFYHTHQSGRLHPNDKKFLAANTALFASGFAVVLALALAGVGSMGVVPAVVVGVFFVLWLIESGASYWVLDRNEKKYQEEHPTLESFIKFLRQAPDNEKAQAVMRKFSPEIRKYFERADEGEDFANWQRVAKALAEKLEKAEKAEKETLKAFLSEEFSRVSGVFVDSSTA